VSRWISPLAGDPAESGPGRCGSYSGKTRIDSDTDPDADTEKTAFQYRGGEARTGVSLFDAQAEKGEATIGVGVGIGIGIEKIDKDQW
jgi:hypothetical protein